MKYFYTALKKLKSSNSFLNIFSVHDIRLGVVGMQRLMGELLSSNSL